MRLPLPLSYYWKRKQYLHPDNIIFLQPGNIFMLRDGRVYKVGYDDVYQLPVKKWSQKQKEDNANKSED